MARPHVANEQDPFVRKVYLEYGPYGYNPNLAAPIIFTIIFGLSCIAHTFQAISKRQYWLLVLAFGTLAEATGNGVRIYGHFHKRVVNPYIAQEVILVVTPVFFAAIHFAILGKILMIFGRKYTLISPKIIIPFFVTLDVISLIVQAVGSAAAGSAETNGKDVTQGGNIVVGGLSVQLLGYVLADILAIVFALRAAADPPKHPLWTKKMQIGLTGAFLSAICVLWRSSWRTAEMATGWIGRISTTEWMYYSFDAAPVALAVILLNIFHPADYLPQNIKAAAEEGEDSSKESEKEEKPPTAAQSDNGSAAVLGSEASESNIHSQA